MTSDLIVAELSDRELLALSEVAADLGIPPDNWRHVPPLRSIFEAVALQRRAGAIRERAVWLSRTRAEELAAAQLGLSVSTVRRRVSRYVTAAVRRAA